MRILAGLCLVAAACGGSSNGGTVPCPGNLWPNGDSEAFPPAGVVVKNDGKGTEWDYRVNVGAEAPDGSWVRSPPLPWGLCYMPPALPGDAAYTLSAQARTDKGEAVLTGYFMDSDYHRLPGSVLVKTSSRTWVPLSVVTTTAPAGAAYVFLEIMGGQFDSICAQRAN